MEFIHGKTAPKARDTLLRLRAGKPRQKRLQNLCRLGRPTWKDASSNIMRESVPSRTRGRRWILLYSECCKTRSEAMSREWYVKHDRKFRTTLRITIL